MGPGQQVRSYLVWRVLGIIYREMAWRIDGEETENLEGSIAGLEDPLAEDMATHSSVLAWRIPWTEEHGGPQSTGSQRLGLV